MKDIKEYLYFFLLLFSFYPHVHPQQRQLKPK